MPTPRKGNVPECFVSSAGPPFCLYEKAKAGVSRGTEVCWPTPFGRYSSLIVVRMRHSRSRSHSSRSSASIFAPSLLATDGSGCVSMKIPSAPAAIDARPIVSIIAGWPPVTPLP